MVKITPEMWKEKRAWTDSINQFQAQIAQMHGVEGDPDVEHQAPFDLVPDPPRPDRQILAVIRKNSPSITHEDIRIAVEKLETPDPDQSTRKVKDLVRAVLLREEGNELFKTGKYDAALEKYLEAMHWVLADPGTGVVTAAFPSPAYYNQVYGEMGDQSKNGGHAWMEFLDALALGGNIAQCYKKLGDNVKSIDWMHEVEQMFFCQRWLPIKGKPSWHEVYLTAMDYWVFQIKNSLRAYQEFFTLGNTGLAAHFAIKAAAHYHHVNADKYPRLRAFREKGDFKPHEMLKYRHPEPHLIDKLQLTCPELQVHGIWERVPYDAKKPCPEGRSSNATFIWKSRLYVCGGVENFQMGLTDFWYMDLETRQWKRLPDVPTLQPENVFGLQAIRPLRVWRDKVHLFTGNLRLYVFDLNTEKWSTLKTTFPGKKAWPYPDSQLTAFNTALIDDTLYVFGGEINDQDLGNNLLMALHLPTAKWERISGYFNMTPEHDNPEVRTLPCMWAVPEQRKIYMMYGSAQRVQARIHNKPHGAKIDHTWSDLWSFHVDQKKWTRERMRGNYPCPRTEAASDFCSGMNRAIVFGGYHDNMQTIESDPDMFKTIFGYAFLGDTFIFNPTTGIWQHVLVKGFPSYRAMSSIACDPDTGKVYLFGGYVNGDFIPIKNAVGKVYHDIWQLRIDTPGGLWAPEDLERDIRAEKMGLWMRCFTCGSCGIRWFKCAGSCKGKYYFCSKECQKDGWKEHKRVHGCRKI